MELSCSGTGVRFANAEWLEDNEQRTWRAFYVATRLIFERVERQLVHEAQMPHAYYEILVLLSEAPGGSLRMGELATISTSSRSRLSHAVARLEDNGWVIRRSSPQDRRASFAEITDDGRKALFSAAPGHVDTVRAALFDALTEAQLSALRDVAEALVVHLAPARAMDLLPGPAAIRPRGPSRCEGSRPRLGS